MPKLNNLLADIDFNIIERAKEQGLPHAEKISETADGGEVVASLISNFLRIATLVASILLLFNLVYGGIQWISSGGDSGKIEKARTRITQSIIGIILLAASIAIFVLINQIIGGPLDIIGGRGGPIGPGGGNPACVCGNGRLARTGAVGKLYLADDAPCFRCTDSGWQSVTGTCSVITCY